MDEQAELGRLRERIDAIDQQLIELISERARCAQAVAEVKMRAQGQDAVFFRPEREAQVIRRVMERNPGPLSDEEMGRLFREVMSACLALERPMHIAYLGPEGTFTHAAALKHFGYSVVTLPFDSDAEIFREVEAGEAHYGVVPVETSTEGIITHTLDRFVTSPLKICGEVQIRTHLFLLAAPGTEPRHIKRIYSHPQSFVHCRQWLEAHFPNAKLVAMSSHGEAALKAAKEPHSAAIAGEICTELFGLNRLERNIEDSPNQITRFLIIGREKVGPSGQDKTVVLASRRNEPGALYELLEPFHRHQISLTRIESRPADANTWTYHFFLEFEGHWEDTPVKAAIAELNQRVSDLRHLGSFPVGAL
ncbi:MAG: prephenate dehydratase [Gammaproteobacteria bacterium]|nr:MAG: prephenate dehydratase [Gammaproteobacteria bacterium]